MTLAKALANGIPIGAMLCREDVASALTAGTHGSTFAGSAFVTSVALATLTTIIGDKIPDRAAQRGRELTDALRALQAKLPVDHAGARQGLPDRHRAVASGRPGHGRLPRRRPARPDRRREGRCGWPRRSSWSRADCQRAHRHRRRRAQREPAS